MEDPSALRMRYKVIGLGKAGLEKGQGSPRRANGPRMLKREWDTGAHKQCKKRPSEHTESLGGK